MFDSRIANVVAYGGLALVLLVPAADWAMRTFDWPNAVSTEDKKVEETPSSLQQASSVPVAQPSSAPQTEDALVPASELIRPGRRLIMTEDQIRWPTEEETAAKKEAEKAVLGEASREIPPMPRPRPEHTPTMVMDPPKPPVQQRVEVPVQSDTVVILGAPERPLGTLPLQGRGDGQVSEQPPQTRANAVDRMRGWTGGSLDEYLRRQQSGAGAPDDRFVPPADVGY